MRYIKGTLSVIFVDGMFRNSYRDEEQDSFHKYEDSRNEDSKSG